MKENKIKILFVKYDYIIKEMVDDITKSIENINDVVKGQNELIACLEKENNPRFAGFIEQLKKQNEQYETQKKILAHRLECVNKVEDILSLSKEASFMLAMLLEAFGVVNKEAKTIQERQDNKEDIEEVDITYTA